MSLHPIDTSLASALPYRGFNPNVEGELDLRGHGVMIGFDMRGPSPESCDLAEVASRARSLAAAILHLGNGDMMHFIYHRLPAPEPPEWRFPSEAAALVDAERRAQFTAENHWITPTRLYLTHQYEPRIQGIVRALSFAADTPQRQARHEILREEALTRFSAFEDAAASGVDLRRLNRREMFLDLMTIVTAHEFSPLQPDHTVRLNEVIGCEYMVNGETPYINGYHLRPVCITQYPAFTVPQILAVLLRHPGRMTISARFICHDTYDAQRLLREERKHWNREILNSVWSAVKKYFGSQFVNQDSQNMIAEIDAAIAAAAAGVSFGHATIVAIIKDSDPDRADLRAQQIRKDCHALGIMARIERVNAAEAIEGSWPGNGDSNIRRPMITGNNIADVTIPCEHWPGLPFIDSEFFPERTPTPFVMNGTGREPFYYPLAVDGVRHQLVLGPTRMGKSTFLAALVSAFTGLPDAKVVWLDLGHSSFVSAHLFGADYRELGVEGCRPLSPLSFLDYTDGGNQNAGLDYIYGWFERLFKRWNYELSERTFDIFARSLRYCRQHGKHSLGELFAEIPDDNGECSRIRKTLKHYIDYRKDVFGAHEALGSEPLSPFSVFELQALSTMTERTFAPAMELILQSIIYRADGSPVLVVADELWRFLTDPTSAEWLFQALRAMRRRNIGFVGATQSLDEIANHPSRNVILESCPVHVFLPNHNLLRSAWARKTYLDLGVNEHECRTIGSASSRKEYYVNVPGVGSRLASLALGDVAKAILACTGYRDVQLAKRILADSPNGLFLDAWLGERLGPDWQRRLPGPPAAKAIAGR